MCVCVIYCSQPQGVLNLNGLDWELHFCDVKSTEALDCVLRTYFVSEKRTGAFQPFSCSLQQMIVFFKKLLCDSDAHAESERLEWWGCDVCRGLWTGLLNIRGSIPPLSTGEFRPPYGPQPLSQATLLRGALVSVWMRYFCVRPSITPHMKWQERREGGRVMKKWSLLILNTIWSGPKNFQVNTHRY